MLRARSRGYYSHEDKSVLPRRKLSSKQTPSLAVTRQAGLCCGRRKEAKVQAPGLGKHMGRKKKQEKWERLEEGTMWLWVLKCQRVVGSKVRRKGFPALHYSTLNSRSLQSVAHCLWVLQRRCEIGCPKAFFPENYRALVVAPSQSASLFLDAAPS